MPVTRSLLSYWVDILFLHLIGRLNKCAVISPRYDVTLGEFEQWTSNVLPARY